MGMNTRKNRRVAAGFFLLIALTATGCAGLRETKRLMLLDDISVLYEQALMTGQYRAAYRFVKADKNDSHPDFDHLKDFQISDYELMDKASSPDGSKALVSVEIRYFHVRHLVEKVLIDQQQWEFDPDQNDWYLTSGLPRFQ